MVYADQTTDAAVDQAVELLEQSGVDDLLSDPDKVVDLIISAKETLGTVNVTDDQISSALDVAAGELGVTLSDSDKSTLIQLYPYINYIITCKIKKAPKIGAYKRGVPRQWFTGAIIMKKLCKYTKGS